MIFVFTIPLAYAHPLIEKSDPASSSNTGAGTTQVIIHYSEAVELDFSYIKVYDSSGEQIDNKDTRYFEDDTALVVTTPPLQEGAYTVSTKVLSKIDGHLVPYSFVFGVGDVSLPEPEKPGIAESIFFPEAGARFPGLVGQVIVLGSVISSLLIWRTVPRKNSIKENLVEIQKFYHTKFSSITGIGLFLVFASNILMLAIQTIRLETAASNVLQTSFGTVWIIRMVLTVILLAVWFLMENKPPLSLKKQGVILGLSLALIGTTTAIGHGAANEDFSAVVIDYIHNLIASIWIGGIIFFGYILLPVFAKLDERKKELISLSMIPKFSSMIIITLGILLITGPTLLWILEDDLVPLSQSYYGQLIIAKIAIAAGMIAIGAYNQVKIQRSAEKTITSNIIAVHKKLKRSLKTEAMLGIALLGVVALLANSSLPTVDTPQAAAQKVSDGLHTTVFSENLRFEVSIEPFSSGANTVSVAALDSNGNPVEDLSNIEMKISNPQRNIVPFEIPLTKVESEDNPRYEGEATFGFSGKWNVEIEAQRTQQVNEGVSFIAFVKPHVSQLKTDITEYSLPESAAPLYPAYDGDNTIWISDTSESRLWKFLISEEQFTPYEFEGETTVFLQIDSSGKIWFTDTPQSKIGYFDPDMEEFTLIPLPVKSIPIALEIDLDDNIWIALVDQHMVLKYDQNTNQFEEYETPTNPSGPAALTRDADGNIWVAESQSGKIAVIDPQTGEIEEFMPEAPLAEPFAFFVDNVGNIWVSEHVGLRIVKFNPVLETFDGFNVTDPNSLPFGLASDKFDNIWIAQHTTDNLGVYDPHKNEFDEVAIPTKSSFTQFVTADKDGNIWFVEQRTNKIGKVVISESPQVGIAPEQRELELRYSEFVTPFISAGIIATSLFFVKSIRDKRRLDSVIE